MSSEWMKKPKPAELRQEIARRVSAFSGDRRRAPLAAAAIASLMAQGRVDVKDREISAEIDALTGALRARFAFAGEEGLEATKAWRDVVEFLEAAGPASAIAHHLAELKAEGLVAGVLWIAGPPASTRWISRRFGAAIAEQLELELRPLEERPS